MPLLKCNECNLTISKELTTFSVLDDCRCLKCLRFLPIPEEFRTNYFALFQEPTSCNINYASLKKKYLAYLSFFHPDRYDNLSEAEIKTLEYNSSFCHTAYQTLSDNVSLLEHIIVAAEVCNAHTAPAASQAQASNTTDTSATTANTDPSALSTAPQTADAHTKTQPSHNSHTDTSSCISTTQSSDQAAPLEESYTQSSDFMSEMFMLNEKIYSSLSNNDDSKLVELEIDNKIDTILENTKLYINKEEYVQARRCLDAIRFFTSAKNRLKQHLSGSTYKDT